MTPQSEFGTCIAWCKTTGWIRPERGGRDVFCHYSAIESDDRFRELTIGARVSFTRGPDPKGRECAIEVAVVEAAA